LDVTCFINVLKKHDLDFFTGVPDSQLKAFVDYLTDTLGSPDRHIIAANEGNAVALAAGYHLATGKIPCVYLQNSGLGNIVNPVVSLLSEKVYQIPCVFVIGWRGEPGLHDEPQHLFQGAITLETLNLLGIEHMVIDKETTEKQLSEKMVCFKKSLDSGKSVAFVVKRDGLSYDNTPVYKNRYSARREDIIHSIVKVAKDDLIIATTGKTARELFEIRKREKQPHHCDFLTVGSMGHSSSIALGVALNQPERRVWCIDGDGAALMHMGAMATIGALSPPNFIHVLVNNEAHESVGGQPTVASKIDFCGIARGCGYSSVFQAVTLEEFESMLSDIQGTPGPIFIEVKSAIGSRSDLGRPTSTPVENKEAFMSNLRGVTK